MHGAKLSAQKAPKRAAVFASSSNGGLDLTQIPCARPRGTQGTPRCNDGRSCGVLAVRSKNVAEIMIGEGLARRYVCGSTNARNEKNDARGE